MNGGSCIIVAAPLATNFDEVERALESARQSKKPLPGILEFEYGVDSYGGLKTASISACTGPNYRSLLCPGWVELTEIELP